MLARPRTWVASVTPLGWVAAHRPAISGGTSALLPPQLRGPALVCRPGRSVALSPAGWLRGSPGTWRAPACPARNVSSSSSGSFYLAAEYQRPTLPFLVINTGRVKAKFFIFLTKAFEKAKCSRSDAFSLFPSFCDSVHLLSSGLPCLQLSPSPRLIFSLEGTPM